MKVALVSPYDFGVPSGVNSHITQLAAELRRRGHRAAIFAPGTFSANVEDVHLIGRSIPVPSGGSLARVTLSPRSSTWVRQQLAACAFDIVHVHEPLVPILPIQFLRHARVPTIGTFHTAREHGSRLYDLNHRWLRRYARMLDGRITVSPASRRLVTQYFPDDYYRAIPNGIHVEWFSGERPVPPQVAALRPYVLFVGRFEKRKGIEVLLRAFARLREEMPDLNLVVVGGGKRPARVSTVVEELGVQNVHFVGYVPDDKLPAYYQQAAVFCAPNTGNESFGMILLEAMASGAPIVASRINGFVDVVSEGEDGILVPPGDPAALAGALSRVLSNPTLANELRAAGQKTVQRYSWDVVSEEILAYYHELIDAVRPRDYEPAFPQASG